MTLLAAPEGAHAPDDPDDDPAPLVVPDPTVKREGVVTLTDWSAVPFAARLIRGVVGQIQVLSSQQALGFDLQGGGHANWLVLVHGHSTVHAIPGCKVSSISYGGLVTSDEYAAVP